jgi:hypothetical protein
MESNNFYRISFSYELTNIYNRNLPIHSVRKQGFIRKPQKALKTAVFKIYFLDIAYQKTLFYNI